MTYPRRMMGTNNLTQAVPLHKGAGQKGVGFELAPVGTALPINPQDKFISFSVRSLAKQEKRDTIPWLKHLRQTRPIAQKGMYYLYIYIIYYY